MEDGASEYVLYDEFKSSSQPSSASPPTQHWRMVLPVIALGFGSHATNHAMMPVQPALEVLGLSPIGYAFLTIAPHIGQVLLPTAWAVAFTRRPRLVLAVAPALLLSGTALLAAGLALHAFAATPFLNAVVAFTLMGLGFACYTVSKSGSNSRKTPPVSRLDCPVSHTPTAHAHLMRRIPLLRPFPLAVSVLQHSILAAVLPTSFVKGLCLMVGTTHTIAAITSWGVPQILDDYGVVGVQLALLAPSAVGLGAGILLGRWMPTLQHSPPPSPMPYSGRAVPLQPFIAHCATCGAVVAQQTPYKTTCVACKKKEAVRQHARVRILLIGAWKASTMGTLHGRGTAPTHPVPHPPRPAPTQSRTHPP